MNARFWIYWNGWVKVTLRPGETITLAHYGETDEGFRSVRETYTHDGSDVLTETDSTETDCDGRHEYTSDAHCSLEHLSATPVAAPGCYDEENPPIVHYAPKWERGARHYRDHYAEAMNY